MVCSTQLIQLVLNPRQSLTLSEQALSDIIHILRVQKLLAIFAQKVIEQSLLNEFSEKAQNHLKNSLVIIQRQTQQVENEARLVNEVLVEQSELVVFLKGAAYTLAGYTFAETRLFNDIDVLVARDNIRQCEQALLLDGWIMQEISSYDDQYYRKWAHEIPPMQHMTRGTVIDVHHNVIPVISGDAPEVHTLAKYVMKLNNGLHIFTRPAQFVHSAVHLLRNEDYEFALRDLFDLYFMINDNDERFIESCVAVASDIGFLYEVGLTLYILKSTFNLPISDNVIHSCLAHKTTIRRHFDQWLMPKVIRAHHPKMSHAKSDDILVFLATIRGHCIKMPLHLLAFHLVVKASRGILERLFGKHIFTPKERQSMEHTTGPSK